jgi:hypothetical protein
MMHAMPGGLPGVRAVVNELHAAGVKVLVPYNPWDSGTRRPANCTKTHSGNALADELSCDAKLLNELVATLNVDGLNGDTLGDVPREFYSDGVALNQRHPTTGPRLVLAQRSTGAHWAGGTGTSRAWWRSMRGSGSMRGE